MFERIFRRILAPALLLILFSLEAIGAESPRYSVTNLGTLGGNYGYAFAINENGQVVGRGYLADDRHYHAFLCDQGTIEDLGALSGDDASTGSGINAAGQIIGNSETFYNNVHSHAFLYENGVMKDLGTFGGKNSSASAINDRGQIVGAADIPGSATFHAFVYENGRMTDLGTLGYDFSSANGINSIGQIVGEAWSYTDPISAIAFLYSGGAMKTIGTLPGFQASGAQDINDKSQVLCYAFSEGDQTHAFLYDNGATTDLGTLGGRTSSGNDINNLGQVVGRSLIEGNHDYHAFLYENGQMTDLNKLIDPASGWTLESAYAINDSGWIVGVGYNPNTRGNAVLLKPVPEPALFVQLGIASFFLLTFTWRRKN